MGTGSSDPDPASLASAAGRGREPEASLPEGDAVGDLEALPVLVGVEVGAHQQRVRRAEC